MKRTARTLVALALPGFVLAATGGDALAYCDTLSFTESDDDVVIGIAGELHLYTFGWVFIQDAGLPVAVCWRTDGGEWQYEETTCDGDSDDLLYLATAGGDDRVAALGSNNVSGWFLCGSEGAIGPWTSGVDVGLYAAMGSGSDLFQGSPRADIAWSNALAYLYPGWYSPADGSAPDKLCGWAGNDTLYGDQDDDWTAAEDYLDGGTGSDYCDGDWGIDGFEESDLHRNCETVYDAWSDVGLNIIQCSLDDNPSTDWN